MKFLNVRFTHNNFAVGVINSEGHKEIVELDVSQTDRIKSFLLDCVDDEQRLQATFSERAEERLAPEFMNFK